MSQTADFSDLVMFSKCRSANPALQMPLATNGNIPAYVMYTDVITNHLMHFTMCALHIPP